MSTTPRLAAPFLHQLLSSSYTSPISRSHQGSELSIVASNPFPRVLQQLFQVATSSKGNSIEVLLWLVLQGLLGRQLDGVGRRGLPSHSSSSFLFPS